MTRKPCRRRNRAPPGPAVPPVRLLGCHFRASLQDRLPPPSASLDLCCHRHFRQRMPTNRRPPDQPPVVGAVHLVNTVPRAPPQPLHSRPLSRAGECPLHGALLRLLAPAVAPTTDLSALPG
ncbi:uncharacterized protein M6B38_326535 [Iris pallida]|uniref:Uncharacterized protein n=1 Tax=Iris pallida TaxID=29817 RepID=A0AAX6H689_IRIPA|nr:uncharacterized protein M6B38_326535 [Iris pallida]